MDNLYLIAHSVRGKPAFDIAILCDDGDLAEIDGHYWIIPTSGHRAYPYWTLDLRKCPIALPPMPSDLPDHYWHDGNDEIQSHLDKSEAALAGRSLAEKLGIVKPTTPLTRRV